MPDDDTIQEDKIDLSQLPSDGEAVLEGVTPPTKAALDKAHKELSEVLDIL